MSTQHEGEASKRGIHRPEKGRKEKGAAGLCELWRLGIFKKEAKHRIEGDTLSSLLRLAKTKRRKIEIPLIAPRSGAESGYNLQINGTGAE